MKILWVRSGVFSFGLEIRYVARKEHVVTVLLDYQLPNSNDMSSVFFDIGVDLANVSEIQDEEQFFLQ